MSAREEIFGPVAGLIPFTTEEDAIEIANDTPYGLAAAIWTTNPHRTQRMVQAVRCRHGLGQLLPPGLVRSAVRWIEGKRARAWKRA
ncbi:aldehyde dehydrogenase family protein [Rhodococcus wratislaviensis]|uniref:Aldehyde dehydrogenase domain-containing protein n=1 Tax=Rhodococcus wratislaviensis NBRC 100605 TaxID=1219028 RepID=X0Q0E2_RHOWR|nr:aldehyde dehydrogenase family protein [Rhodococcus wratislaviensis]GAF49459.1 hypothetical protein RW1_085_00020 [Rhodococcus wratislaviensis NBRC 100605]